MWERGGCLSSPCSLVPPGCSAAISVPPHEWEMHPLCHLLLALFLKKLGCFNVCYPNTESVALSSMQINSMLTKNHSKWAINNIQKQQGLFLLYLLNGICHCNKMTSGSPGYFHTIHIPKVVLNLITCETQQLQCKRLGGLHFCPESRQSKMCKPSEGAV